MTAAVAGQRTGSFSAVPAEGLARVCALAAEHAGQSDLAAEFPAEVLLGLRESGLLGLLVPVEHDGLGGDVEDMIDVTLALGRADLSAAMIFAMHCQQVAAVVDHPSPVRAELLAEIAAGRIYLASVTTEAGTGGHLLTSDAGLAARDGRLQLDRMAPIVTGGSHADGFLITMRSPDADSPHSVSLLFARRDQLTITECGDWDPLGMRASRSNALRLVGAVPAGQLIGEQGQFNEITLRTFAPLAHLGWSAAWLGTAAGALSRVLTMLRSPQGRKGGALDSELLLTRLSSARQRLDTVHALLRRSSQLYRDARSGGADLSRPNHQLLLNSLKLTASEQCYAAVEELVTAVGLRHGYLKGSPTGLERALRDLRSANLNYHNDRLHLADGRLALLDPGVRFV